ncbi:Uncharacterised protein [uncultured archaeon]|nr:Uncharacterised protein [uncultured archaeon]
METEHININGKITKCESFAYDEIKSIFNDEDWNRTFKDAAFLEKVGLSAPPKTFLVAGSYCSAPTKDGKIAGICMLRTDEKDRPKGFPVNWNHWNFFLYEKKVLMIPSNNKLDKHWFKSEEEWQEFIKNNPPHKNNENDSHH